jgi:FkbM family methyltransferase
MTYLRFLEALKLGPTIKRSLLAFQSLGPLNAIKYNFGLVSEYAVLSRTSRPRKLARLGSKQLSHPVHYRPFTSDIWVFSQIFVDREYVCFDHLSDVELIIDLGANVGYSAAYFLSRFPKSFVVAVEPDNENLALLKMNLAPYQGRYIAVHAAVWPEKTALYFDPASPGLGEWGRRVTADKQKGDEVQAVDIESLISMTDYHRISVLKIDIEGAERELFARNYALWLNRTENLCIEVHGDQCRIVVEKAISGAGFALSTSGELTIGMRRTAL